MEFVIYVWIGLMNGIAIFTIFLLIKNWVETYKINCKNKKVNKDNSKDNIIFLLEQNKHNKKPNSYIGNPLNWNNNYKPLSYKSYYEIIENLNH